MSCIKFKDALNLSVGMSTGQVGQVLFSLVSINVLVFQILLFDIRSSKPYFIKDHNYNLPIKRIDFHTQNDDYILSMDKKICKIWNRHTVNDREFFINFFHTCVFQGKNLTSIEPGTPLNDMLNIPGSGLICLTNDSPKIFAYYIPVNYRIL